MASSPHSPRPTEHLERVLGPWMATALVVGTVIGSGVFKKPQAVAESVPFPGLALTIWTLGGVLTLFGALSVAEIAVLFPQAGEGSVPARTWRRARLWWRSRPGQGRG